ncbi:MAG: tRNA dimethylallyltransferase [Hyphomicrobiaceae bacterium]|jgi:tRNA dimethylallyltransferase
MSGSVDLPLTAQAGHGLDEQTGAPPRVLVIAGPTASGKSAAAVSLAEEYGAEIVGADSRQIYRYMEIGTAKPTAAERERVRHHLVDVACPDERWDAARWRAAAVAAITDIQARGRRVIVCGGTGLYLRSLERGLFGGPSADETLRARLEEQESQSLGVLHRRLHEVDAASAARIHPNDQLRVIRALEVFELTGRPLSEWHAEHALGERSFDILILEMVRDRLELADRIAIRSESMVREGIVAETQELRRRFGSDAPGLGAIGYREAGQVLDQDLAEADLPAAIAASTRAYAKRQRTWLRGQAQPARVQADDKEKLRALAAQFYS